MNTVAVVPLQQFGLEDDEEKSFFYSAPLQQQVNHWSNSFHVIPLRFVADSRHRGWFHETYHRHALGLET